MNELIGAVIVLIGSFFLFTASIGLLRMPDFFNRIQAGTKASTLGTLFTLIGIAVINPVWWPKIVVISLFVLITNPVSSHVMARAGYYKNCEKGKMERDDLDNLSQMKKEEQ